VKNYEIVLGCIKNVLETVFSSKLIILSNSLQGVTRRDHSCQNMFSSKNRVQIERKCESERLCSVASKRDLERVYMSKLIIQSNSLQSVIKRDHSCKIVFNSKNKVQI
jgi:hypothetical protein